MGSRLRLSAKPGFPRFSDRLCAFQPIQSRVFRVWVPRNMDLTSLTTAAKLLVNANADVDVRTDLNFQQTMLMEVTKKNLGSNPAISSHVCGETSEHCHP